MAYGICWNRLFATRIILGCLFTAAAAASTPPTASDLAAPTKGDAKLKTQSIPFQLAKPDKPIILLQTKVNGRGPFRFVLDTGAALTMVSPELAKKLDIRPAKRQQATGAGGNIEIRFGTVKSLEVGGTRVNKLQVGVMDLNAISKACGTVLDGIVGYNFLKKFRVVIDYPKQLVTFE